MDRVGHFPEQVAIDAYGSGGFRFAEMSHRGDLLSLPTGMSAWVPPPPEQLTAEHFAEVFALADRIDVLLVGTGIAMVRPATDLRAACAEAGIVVEAMGTGAAVRTYNVLVGERRAVAAAFYAVGEGG